MKLPRLIRVDITKTWNVKCKKILIKNTRYQKKSKIYNYIILIKIVFKTNMSTLKLCRFAEIIVLIVFTSPLALIFWLFHADSNFNFRSDCKSYFGHLEITYAHFLLVKLLL